ncbi:hypothetical protein BU24DRAFT_458222 [Aaosphaeria arxii CBS 175.79]|uniref:F-box domain-containing protein n=1 Tax=Aaosphaeria arxii CBS 175.79 TaxID=1450172 RepID=A0A6A5Y9V6_9PLEO|nr:uncharacterized protein BU24DRAFT_458222 [Aaosphaeria arxii CBS 175.79]KAF2022365.1 hypothetical protein BU24DRAFT_458222 [Aaosphaeria arxii CBS 175.79]
MDNFAPLLRLPREVRDMIYHYVFSPTFPNNSILMAQHLPSFHIWIPYPKSQRNFTIFPVELAPICLTNTQLYRETINLYLKTIILEVTLETVADALLQWLSQTTPPQQSLLDSIHHLSLQSLTPQRNRKRLDFLVSCPNLRSLTLHLKYKYWQILPKSLVREMDPTTFFNNPYILDRWSHGRRIYRREWDLGENSAWCEGHVGSTILKRLVEVYRMKEIFKMKSLEMFTFYVEAEAAEEYKRGLASSLKAHLATLRREEGLREVIIDDGF